MVIALSSLDLHFLMPELKELEGAKIEKIFQLEEEYTFLFNLHIPSKGKKYLFISLPSLVCITDFKPPFPNVPPHFCSALRRKITGARINKIEQRGFERILIMNLTSSKGDSKLIFELFSNGNIILVDEENKILSIAHQHSWESKILRPGKEYSFPPEQLNPLELNKDDFISLIKKSDKESLVKALAIELSLGGLYSEQLLAEINVDKNISPIEVDEEDLAKVYSEMKKLLDEKKENFNEEISKKVFNKLEKKIEIDSSKEKKEKVSKLNKVLNAQKFQLEGLDKSQLQNQEKGELIYKHYAEIEEILKLIQNRDDWKEVKEKLKEKDIFVSLDEHNGTLTLDLK